MNGSRAAALPIVLMIAALAACSSGPETSPSPTTRPARSPSDALAVVSSTSPPELVDKDCADFPHPTFAQEFYIEAGGPDQDLHGLDPDRNGNACDEPSPSPSPRAAAAAAATTRPVQVTTPTTPAPAGTPNAVNSSSGVVDGKSGGSESHSSCESSDPARCD